MDTCDLPDVTMFARRAVKKTRSAWRCAICGVEFPAGTPCLVDSGKEDGVFFTMRRCTLLSPCAQGEV